MPLNEKDLEILKIVRDAEEGCLERNHVAKVFKRAGATVITKNGMLHIVFTGSSRNYNFPMNSGFVDFEWGRHFGFRRCISRLAADLLHTNSLA